ncbi:unnamed protein product [Rhodiola kirilowii]
MTQMLSVAVIIKRGQILHKSRNSGYSQVQECQESRKGHCLGANFNGCVQFLLAVYVVLKTTHSRLDNSEILQRFFILPPGTLWRRRKGAEYAW